MKKLLILDLDNTLIYTHTFRDMYHDFVLEFKNDVHYYVIKRPYLKEFLEYCNINYRIAFWSAATEDYVQQVIKNIAPNIDPVFVWSYEKCTVNMYKSFYDTNLNIYKRLRKVWSSKKYNASKKDILILDDTPLTYSYNYGNAIYITKFFGLDDDVELIRIKELLETIKDCDDVRQIYKLD